MSTAAELLDPKVFASIRAEFHEVFVQRREEVRKLRSGVRASKSAQSGRDRHQAASEDGTLVDTKRSREGKKCPGRSLERPMIIEDAPNTTSGTTKGQSSPTVKGIYLQHKGQSQVGHPEEDDGYVFVLQTTEPTADHLKLVFPHPSQKDPFEGFRIVMQAIATKMKTIAAHGVEPESRKAT